MANPGTFDPRVLSLIDISNFYRDYTDAVILYFNPQSPNYERRFVGYNQQQIDSELSDRLYELELQCCFLILTSIEAAFRIDYGIRRKARRRDAVSRAFREIKKESTAISFEDEILEVWKQNLPLSSQFVGEIKGAFNLRHWIAHGRYWVARLGRKYDFGITHSLAEKVFTHLPLLGR